MASATHVYRNGTILTMDSGGSQAQALAVRGETILAVGSDAEIMALADPHTVVTDLRGRTMLPGFIDGHSHFVSARPHGGHAARSFLAPGGRREEHRRDQGTDPREGRRNSEGRMDSRFRLRRHRP